jgi:hypothetical protein
VAWRRLAILAIALGAMQVLRVYLSANGGFGPEHVFLADTYRMSHTNLFGDALPLVFLVALVVYFGPVVGVVLLRWREVSGRLAGLGPGPALAAGLGIALSLNSQSRWVLVLVPLFVVGAVLAVDEVGISQRGLIVFAGLSLLFSKVWLWIPDLTATNLETWPNQWYFMSFGPWMSPLGYAIQGVFVIGALAALWRTSLRNGPVGRAAPAKPDSTGVTPRRTR